MTASVLKQDPNTSKVQKQNDWDLLRATAVTQGWNGYRKYESGQKDNSLAPVLPGIKLATFQSNHGSGALPLSCHHCVREFISNTQLNFPRGKPTYVERLGAHNTTGFG